MSELINKSRLRNLRRDRLERLCVELAKDLLNTTVYVPPMQLADRQQPGERRVETADEASEVGLQSLAMAMDPAYDYLGLDEGR